MGQCEELLEMSFPFPGVCLCPHASPGQLLKAGQAHLPDIPAGWGAQQTKHEVCACLHVLQQWSRITAARLW